MFLPGESSWTKKPGRLQSIGHTYSDTMKGPSTHSQVTCGQGQFWGLEGQSQLEPVWEKTSWQGPDNFLGLMGARAGRHRVWTVCDGGCFSALKLQGLPWWSRGWDLNFQYSRCGFDCMSRSCALKPKSQNIEQKQYCNKVDSDF